MAPVPPARHLVRAKDAIDARYAEPLDVRELARAAHMSRAHFIREFKDAFGETPHQYLLTRRLERAAALLRNTDWTVSEICFSIGLSSVGSFTTSFRRHFGITPTAYRAEHPPAAERTLVPPCIVRAWTRPSPALFEKAVPGDRASVAADRSTNKGADDVDEVQPRKPVGP